MDVTKDETILCPYCGEKITLLIDCSAGSQDYFEDCQVCCRPILVCVAVDTEGLPTVDARREDE